ncbi:MAG TPA: NAD-dependent epimerase/dehydratase family protein [Polyangiaceae bacterium]|nr:NAD-dependent epimerase/dehydratase family protein [Polyangiaceae bacterium]
MASNDDRAGGRRLWVGGATGFLGRNVVRALRARGHEVVAVSRSGGTVDDVRVAQVDVLDESAVKRSAEGCDGAFLCTGKVTRNREASEELYQAHVVGTQRALDGLRAAGVKRAVVASTSGTLAVSTRSDRIADEGCRAPLEIIAVWPYYRTKLYAEREALARNTPPDFEVVIVNPSLLLGPGDARESSTKDVRLFLEGSIPATPAGGMAFVDARDAALGMLLAWERGRPGERYILNAQNTTVAAFFQRLSRLSGVPAPLLRMPGSRPLAVGIGKLFTRAVRAIGGEPPVDEVSIEMGQYFWYCDGSKAERELGFSPRDPGETLRDTVNDLVERKVVFPKRAARLDVAHRPGE